MSVTYDGEEVPFSLTSDSGTDWRLSQIPVNEAPAPGTLALLGIGLLPLALRRRRPRD